MQRSPRVTSPTRVWGEKVPATAAKALHNHIARIRQVAPGVVRTSGTGYQLDEAVTLDVEQPDDSNAVPFADLADTTTTVGDRHRIQERLAAQQELRLGEAVAAGVTPELLERLHLAVDAEPLRERRWHYLALAQARLGQRRDALLTLQHAPAASWRRSDWGLVRGYSNSNEQFSMGRQKSLRRRCSALSTCTATIHSSVDPVS